MDAAAKQFSEGSDSAITPMEFVNNYKKSGKLIMGIGHRVKSVILMSLSVWLFCVKFFLSMFSVSNL